MKYTYITVLICLLPFFSNAQSIEDTKEWIISAIEKYPSSSSSSYLNVTNFVETKFIHVGREHIVFITTANGTSKNFQGVITEGDIFQMKCMAALDDISNIRCTIKSPEKVWIELFSKPGTTFFMDGKEVGKLEIMIGGECIQDDIPKRLEKAFKHLLKLYGNNIELNNTF